jgi:hypothetical protein
LKTVSDAYTTPVEHPAKCKKHYERQSDEYSDKYFHVLMFNFRDAKVQLFFEIASKKEKKVKEMV